MTKNEPDYRLFLIRILSNLAKLDDRPVRESEKTTAEIHFTQNKKWNRFQEVDKVEKRNPKTAAEEKIKYKNERADYVKNVKIDHLKEDFVGILDGIWQEHMSRVVQAKKWNFERG